HFRRILQIRVDHYHAVASRVVDPGCDRDLMSEVAREFDQSDAPVAGGKTHELAIGIVLATVVDEQNLVVAAAERAERRGRPRVERGDPLGFVEHRDDHRDKMVPIHRSSGMTPAVYRYRSALLPKLRRQHKRASIYYSRA